MSQKNLNVQLNFVLGYNSEKANKTTKLQLPLVLVTVEVKEGVEKC